METGKTVAKRLVFFLDQENNFTQKEYEFKWYSGFAKTQLQKSVNELQKHFLNDFPNKKILEVTSASENILAKELSAMNLQVMTSHGNYTVEQLFQAGKVFRNTGSQEKLLKLSSRKAKQENKVTNAHDELVEFKIFNTKFPLEPKTYFYNWIYMKALHQHPDLVKEVVKYDAFTDIFFNSQKSINCQAQACSIYVSLLRRGILEETLASKEKFLKNIYD